MAQCPYCRFTIPNNALNCGHCSKEQPSSPEMTQFTIQVWFWLIAGFLLLGALGSCIKH